MLRMSQIPAKVYAIGYGSDWFQSQFQTQRVSRSPSSKRSQESVGKMSFYNYCFIDLLIYLFRNMPY